MKDIKELVNLANELDARGYQKEADALDQIIKQANLVKTAGGPSSYGEDASRGQELFVEAMQAYWKATDTTFRNWYSGDDQEVAQRVIDAAQEYFDANEYGPNLPKGIIQAGMYVEAGPASMGDSWQGARSLFQSALEGGEMAGPWLFAGLFQNAAEMPTKLWDLFKAENERRYKEKEEEERKKKEKKEESSKPGPHTPNPQHTPVPDPEKGVSSEPKRKPFGSGWGAQAPKRKTETETV